MGWALVSIGTTEMHTGLWCRNLKGRYHFEVLRLRSGIRQDKIKMILREIRWYNVDCNDLAQDR